MRRSGCGSGPPSSSARCASRCAPARLGVARSSRRGGRRLASSVSIWRSTRARHRRGWPAARRASCVARNRSRLRSRAASSSSSWPIWASEKPASSRRLRMNRQALEVRRVEQAVGAVGAGGRLEQPDLLVVADRARRQAGLGGDLLDAQEARLDGRRGTSVTGQRYHNLDVDVKVRPGRHGRPDRARRDHARRGAVVQRSGSGRDPAVATGGRSAWRHRHGPDRSCGLDADTVVWRAAVQ